MKKALFVLPVAALAALASCGQNPAESSSHPSSSQPPSSQPEEPVSSAVDAGDSKESESESAETGSYFIKEPTKITLVSTLSYTDDLEYFIESFKEIEPNVTVESVKESTGYDGLKDKIVDGIAVDNYADLAVLYPDAIGTLMDYGVVRQLDSYIENPSYGWSEEDVDDIVPAYLEEGKNYTVPGTFSLPFCKSTEAMFYNKVLVGLDLSSVDATINGGNALSEEYLNNLTWEELFDRLCPAIIAYNNGLDDDHKILRDNGTYSKAVFGYDSDDNLFITLAKQYGYGYTDIDAVTGEGKLLFNNDGMKGIVKKLKSAYDNGYLITKGSSNGGNYTNYSFTAGSALFSVGSTGGLKYQVKDGLDTGVARIPQAEAGEGHVNALINQGPSICVLDHKDDNRALAAWLFYKHMTNEANALKWALDTGYSPVRFSAMESDDYLDICNEQDKEKYSLDMVKARTFTYVADPKVAGSLFTSPVFKGSDSARKQVGSIITTLLKKDSASFNDAVVDEEFAKAENAVKTNM